MIHCLITVIKTLEDYKMEKLRRKIARWLNNLAYRIDEDFDRDACEGCGSLEVSFWDSEGTALCIDCRNELTHYDDQGREYKIPNPK